MKIIPKKIKIKNTIWKNYSLLELCIALVIFIVLFLMFTSDQKIISLILGGIFLILYLPVGDDLFYIYVLEIIIYIFKKKKYSNSNIKKISLFFILGNGGRALNVFQNVSGCMVFDLLLCVCMCVC